MVAEYTLLVLIQVILLTTLYYVSGIRPTNGPSVFSPVAWILMFYVITFLVPQAILPFHDYTLLAPGNVKSASQLGRLIIGQRVCVAFLGCFLVGFCLTGRRSPTQFRLQPFSSIELTFVTVAGLIGLAAVALLIMRFNPNMPRSSLVKSSVGKVLYAMSFWLTLATIVWSSLLYKKRRWILIATILLVFGFSLFLLGGRGRVVWPIASTFAWLSIRRTSKIRPVAIASFAVVFLLVLQTLDPLLFLVRGENINRVVERLQVNMSVQSLFVDRNFESFQNVAVISSYDRVRPQLRYIFGGSQQAFMTTYFPEIASRGIGLPASLPGGLWLAGRFPMVVIGSLAFGVFFGILSHVYSKLQTEFEVTVYCVTMPWLGLISGAYLEMYTKVAAAILPGLIFAIFIRYAVGNRKLRLSHSLRIDIPRFTIWK